MGDGKQKAAATTETIPVSFQSACAQEDSPMEKRGTKEIGEAIVGDRHRDELSVCIVHIAVPPTRYTYLRNKRRTRRKPSLQANPNGCMSRYGTKMGQRAQADMEESQRAKAQSAIQLHITVRTVVQ